MKTIVFGATGGTGAAVIRLLRAEGDDVTAFVRNPARLTEQAGVALVTGDVMNPPDVAAAMPGHDRVVISLGNSQNPFALLLGAKRTTPRDVCETGTINIIAAMQAAGVRRVVCVTAFGIGATRTKSPLMFKIFYSLVLREHMADKERQEAALRASSLDWTLVQPVGLTDQPATGTYTASPTGALGKQTMGRADVARYILTALADPATIGQSIALSG
ncbi:MAG: hypothetical protein B7Z58_17200 [Acidiphilium sp. 37-64-53]|uniref:NAD(P)-dependent oxidoreductase n=1 Tax=Acidiphilium TaxID=522 RepID=UPI000BC4D285|nr:MULTISPECIES: NAD(P)-binding oxidoreductase [Acidiphilium]OYV99956.1 MAG: hypothetical protein B7Z58_17200 [Acidiphilium sp. 37-64-53]OZB23445.1 MAG: hypothetical protein B7X49_16120 [Acidiphilium sp. 34-64-41]HQT86639.1 SDR family oxidoreductase [Acidiphilium rubrum]